MSRGVSALDQLARLAGQRRARTEALESAVHELLSLLEEHVEVGDRLIAEGYVLSFIRRRTNVGTHTEWRFSRPEDDEWEMECDLARNVGGEGYVHGDFNAKWRGPTRVELQNFARHARTFVKRLTERFEQQVNALGEAAANVESAKELLAEAEVQP